MKVIALARDIVARVGHPDSLPKLQRRVSRLDTHALADWTAAAVAGIGRAVDDWQKDGDPDSLQEARMGAATLLVALDELNTRVAARPKL